MQRLLLAIVVVLAALLLARDPYVEKADAFFLDWLLRNTPASGDHAPLTVVEIGGGPTVETQPNQQAPGNSPESRRSARCGLTARVRALFPGHSRIQADCGCS